MRLTKIMCTLGPASNDYRAIRALMANGMDAARFNVSHGSHEEHAKRLKLLRKAALSTGRRVAAVMDTKGPEIRTANTEPIPVQKGQRVYLSTLKGACIPITKDLSNYAKKGSKILIDDGRVEMEVVSSGNGVVAARVLNGEAVKPRKSIAVPGARLDMPFLSKVDREDLKFAARNGFDYVAASFTRTAEDVRIMRRFIKKCGGKMGIIAKIESREGVENLDEIMAEADCIMVARGDLGVDFPLEMVPSLQRMMVEKCVEMGKMAIVATQMLDSMVDSPRPTRAEASDIAGAVWQGAAALMLSNETAAGDYPVQSLGHMSRIAEQAEKVSPSLSPKNRHSVTAAIGGAISRLADDVGAEAVVSFTKSGFTAQLVSRERLSVPVIAITNDVGVARKLCLEYGVLPRMSTKRKETKDKAKEAAQEARKHLGKGKRILVTYGSGPWETSTTDTIKVAET